MTREEDIEAQVQYVTQYVDFIVIRHGLNALEGLQRLNSSTSSRTDRQVGSYAVDSVHQHKKMGITLFFRMIAKYFPKVNMLT